MVSCRSAPASTVMRGPPSRPCRSTSHPASVSSACRPDDEPGEVRHRAAGDEADVGRRRQPEQVEQPARRRPPRRPLSPGVANRRPVFWSQALTSQSVASAAGSVPPITQPKKRPDPMAISPGSAAAASRSTTSRRVGGSVRQRSRRGRRRPRRRPPAAGSAARAPTPATRGRGGGRGPAPRRTRAGRGPPERVCPRCTSDGRAQTLTRAGGGPPSRGSGRGAAPRG